MVAEDTAMSSVIPWFETPTMAVSGVPIDVPTLLAVLGGLVALAMARRGARVAGLSPRGTVDAMGLAILSGVVFGRLGEVLYYPRLLAEDWRILLPWRGGFASLGVLVGALLSFTVLAIRTERLCFWRTVDVLVPAGLLGATFVRVGCFLGHHHAGRLAHGLGTVAYPGGVRYDLGLCEALLLLVILAALASFGRRGKRKTGWVAVAGVTAYAAGRFALEFLRGNDLESIGRRSDARWMGLTLVQYASAGLVMAGLIWLWVARSRPATPSTTKDREHQAG